VEYQSVDELDATRVNLN